MTNLTGDRSGTLLEPGDPVMYFHDEETALSATMLRVVGQQYPIQLDPTGPRATTEVTHLAGVMDKLRRPRGEKNSRPGPDGREVFRKVSPLPVAESDCQDGGRPL